MSSELITLVAALGGTMIGGFINYFASRNMKDREWRMNLAKERISIRQALYSEFLVSSQRLVIKAYREPMTKIFDHDIIGNEFARIELLGAPTVVEAARQICNYLLTADFSGKGEEKRNFSELKNAFINAAKDELATLEKA